MVIYRIYYKIFSVAHLQVDINSGIWHLLSDLKILAANPPLYVMELCHEKSPTFHSRAGI
jgi:hypothetical protein